MGYNCERCGVATEREGKHADPFSCVVMLKAELARKDRQITTLSTELVKAGELNERIAKLSNRIAQNNLRHTATINALLWVYNRLQIRLIKISSRRWNWRHLADHLTTEVEQWKRNYFKEKTMCEEVITELRAARPKYANVPQTGSPGDGEYRVDTNFLAELATQTTQTELDQQVSDSLQKGG